MNDIRNCVIILLLTLSINVLGQLTEFRNNLNGSVKQVILNDSSYNGIITNIKDYDIDGFLKVECFFNGYTYNKDSLKIRNKFSYKIDNKKRISEILIVNKDKEKCKKIIKYKFSLYTINTLWRIKGKWESYDRIEQFTNNHKDYKTKVVLELGMFHEYYKCNKDKTQLLQMRFETNEEDWEEYTYNYTYNERGLLVSKDYKVKIDSLFDIQFYHDSLGNIHNKYIFNSTKSSSFNTEYKYDEFDNCIQEIKFDHNGNSCVTNFQFDYDVKDNWIKMEKYINGEQIDNIIREIIYFN